MVGMDGSRYLSSRLGQDLKKSMVLLSGPRQCGKTTLAKSLLATIPGGVYLNYDQTKDRKRIQAQDWSEDTRLLVLDEIHKKKSWKTFLKGIFDTKPVLLQMLVTGSARLELFQRSGDSMFGRYHQWRLHPFCLAEDPLHLSPSARFERQLERGGFPFPYLEDSADEVQRWRNQRWLTLLREDLRDLESVKNVQAIELLAELLKSRAAGMLSYSNLAEDVEVAPKTIKSWVQILEKLYLIHLVRPYSGSIKRALSKTPKVYFLDPGDLLDQSLGARVENLIALNLLKRCHYIEDAYGDALELMYIRDKEEREVDFVITYKRRPVALLEVKTSAQEPSPSLIYFRDRLRVSHVIQLHTESGSKMRIKNGVRILAAQEFFARPIERRRFWEPNEN